MWRCVGVCAAIIALGTAAPATAADLRTRAPIAKAPLPVYYNWSGFYIGGQIGWTKVDDDFSDPVASIFGSASADGFIGGGHVGWNYQAGNIVFGIEADIEGASASGSGTGFFNGIPQVTGSADLNWQASVRARLGIAVNRVLFYATGGVAFGNFDFAYTFPINPPNDTDRFSDTLTGWTVGAGLEAALWANWTGRVEYRFTDFGDATGSIINCCAPPPFHQRHEVESHSVRVGLSYRFGGPIAARY